MYHVSKAIVQASSVSSKHIPSGKDSLTVETQEKVIKRIRHVFRLPKLAIHRIWRNTKIGLSYFPGLGYLNPLLDDKRPKSENDTIPDDNVQGRSETSNQRTLINEDFQQQINRENIDRFNHRRNIIERQVNSIFIYPLTYVLLYIFPLIQQCLYYTRNSGTEYKDTIEPIYWLALVAAWMKPFNCFVDTCVFLIREGAIPCLSPSSRVQKRNERYGIQQQQQQPPFVSPNPENGVFTNLPARPASTAKHHSMAQGHNLVTFTEPIDEEEDEYYPGADIEIDYIIRNNQRPSMSGVNDEENTIRSSLHPELSATNSNRASSAWLRRVASPINSILRPDRQTPTSTHQPPTRPQILVPTSSSLQNPRTNRWTNFSFAPLDTTTRKPSAGSSSMSPYAETTTVNWQALPPLTAEEVDPTQLLPGTGNAIEADSSCTITEPPLSKLKSNDTVTTAAADPESPIQKLKRAVTAPIKFTPNFRRPSKLLDSIHTQETIHNPSTSPTLRPSNPPRIRASTEIHNNNNHHHISPFQSHNHPHIHWNLNFLPLFHSSSTDDNNDNTNDSSNHNMENTNNNNNEPNKGGGEDDNVGEMGLREFLDMF